MSKANNQSPGDPIFLSYAEEDSLHAEKFHQWLVRTFQTGCFMARKDVKAGPWYPQITGAISACAVGVVLVTSRSFRREWVNFEAGALISNKKPTFLIQLKEPEIDSKATQLKPLEQYTHIQWSAESAKEIAKQIEVALRSAKVRAKCQPPDVDFCVDPVELGPQNEADLIEELYNSRPFADAPYLQKRFLNDTYDLAAVLIDPFITEYCSVLKAARVGDGIVPLATRHREEVATKIVSRAQLYIRAISIVSNDPWLFTLNPELDPYIAANFEAGERLAKRGQNLSRVIIFDSANEKANTDSRVQRVLESMRDRQIVLKWIVKSEAQKILEANGRAVENLLIADDRWMTESQGRGHNGHFVVSRDRIKEGNKAFEKLWINSHDF